MMTFKLPKYDENAIQSFAAPWWRESRHGNYMRGELIWAFVPHVAQVPMSIQATGRGEPTCHQTATYKIEECSITKPNKPNGLPVAGLPIHKNENLHVYRAKKRPALIISVGGDEISKKLNPGKSRWTTAPTILVAPYYGNEMNTARGGCLSPLLRQQGAQCKYPQFMVEKLPFANSSSEESVLRFDHVQPIGRHQASIEKTNISLTDEALEVIDQWLHWLISGSLPEDTFLYDFRDAMCSGQ